MLRASFVLLALSCAAPLPSLAEPLRFAGDDGCPYLCPGTPQRPGYLVEALSQVLREPPHFDSLPWPRAVQMVRDGHRDGLVGAYGLDGLRVGSEPIGWVGLAFYTRHDSDWHYSGDASLLGQRLGLAQGYVNNPRFEAWRSQAGDDDLHLQVLGGERVLPRNLQKLLLGRIDVLLEDRDIIEHYLEHHPQARRTDPPRRRTTRAAAAARRPQPAPAGGRRASRGTRRRATPTASRRHPEGPRRAL